jgi:hypothetical protein
MKLICFWLVYNCAEFSEGNTAQYVCGIFRKNRAPILSLFLEIHKVFLRKTAFIRTRFFSESALAALCGIALSESFGNARRKLRILFCPKTEKSPSLLGTGSFR